MRNYVLFAIMDIRVSATELVRSLGEVLGRVRFRGESFLVERNGEPVARVVPVPARSMTLGDLLRLWNEAGATDPDFADDLDEVDRSDRPPDDPWDS
jgi:prevent-host-death family protein